MINQIQIVIVISIFTLMVILSPALAQDNITATPAPSKTPTSAPDLSSESTEQPVASNQTIEPKTQADLSILTGNVQRPNGIIWFDNRLYAVCTGDSTIYDLDSVTGTTRTYIWGIMNAHSLYAEQNAQVGLELWVPDFQTNRLLRVDRNGVDPITTDLAGPWGITNINETEFAITNLQANNVVIANRNGEIREIITGLRAPTGIAADEANLYIANTGSARRAIEWIARSDALEGNQSASETQPLVTGLQNTTGMVMAEDGFLYFAYALGTRGVVGRVNPQVCLENGGCTNNEVEIVVYTELAAPLAGLTISPDMRLFVHTIFSPDIYWVQLDAQGQTPPAEF